MLYRCYPSGQEVYNMNKARNNESQLTAVRIPLDLDARLRKYAANQGTSVSRVIIDALAAYLTICEEGGAEG